MEMHRCVMSSKFCIVLVAFLWTLMFKFLTAVGLCSCGEPVDETSFVEIDEEPSERETATYKLHAAEEYPSTVDKNMTVRDGGVVANTAIEFVRFMDQSMEYKIHLRRTPECPKLGVDIRQTAKRLTVERIGLGLVSEWNETYPEREVLIGDVLVEVDGSRGGADHLMRSISTSQSMTLVFRRGG